MNDLRERLDQDLENLEPSAGAFEATQRRVRRRERNRRLGAAALGVFVTVGVVAALWSLRLGRQTPRSPVARSPSSGASSTPKAPTGASIQVAVYPLGQRSDQMPTGSIAAGQQVSEICTQVFTWTLPDGTKVEGVADPSSEHAIPACRLRDTAVRVAAGQRISVSGDSTTYLRASRTMAPLYPGLTTFALEARWPQGKATFLIPLMVVLTDSSPTRVDLACAEVDQIPFAPPKGARVLPLGAAYIVGNLPGIHPQDIVEQMTRSSERPSPTTEWNGTWQVVRNGSVVAAVHYPKLDGAACRGALG
jgi:hypothetical protein